MAGTPREGVHGLAPGHSSLYLVVDHDADVDALLVDHDADVDALHARASQPGCVR